MPVLIAGSCRSPFTPVEGALAGWHPVDLAAHVMNETLRRATRDAHDVDEVWIGCAEPVGAQGADMARAAVLAAGWPDHVGGTVVDRAETSGTAALHAAIATIESGMIRTAMVIGVCNASMVQPGASALARTYGRPWGDGPAQRVEEEGGLLPAAVAADRAAGAAGIDRSAQDDWATGSYERRSLLAPSSLLSTGARPGDRAAIQRGTPVTQDIGREAPADPSALPPGFDPKGAVTGFTFSSPVDGAAALLLTAAEQRDPEVLAVGRSAGHPLDPLGGLEGATRDALRTADCRAGDIDRWEIAEPTAAAALLAIDRLGIERELVNPAGGTLGVGDASAAEELRLITDGIAFADAGSLLGAAAFGPTGAAVTIIRCP